MLNLFHKERLNQYLLLSLTIVFIIFIFGDILINLNSQLLLERSGDSVKNYYSFLNHVKNDDSFINSTNYNYPFGENIIFSDSTPLLATVTKFLNTFLPLSGYLIGIFNFLIIFSIVFSSWVIYKLAREYKISALFSILLSIGMILLTPQFMRIEGHYSLFFSFPIPLSWLLTVRYIKTKEKKYALLNALTIFLIYFLHPYLGLITNGFSALTLASYYILSYKTFSKKLIWIAVQSILPILLFFIFNSIIDSHTDRPQFAWGTLVYQQKVNSLFSSNFSFLNPFTLFNGKPLKVPGEAYLYLGWYSILAIVTILSTGIYSIIKKKKPEIKLNKANVSLLLSVLILFYFSLGLPLIDLKALIYKFPIISQFRTISRFSFPMFYFALIMLTLFLNNWVVKSKKNKNLKAYFVILLLLILIGEGFYIAKGFTKSKDNSFIEESYDNQLFTEDYQAIIPMPLYFNGGTHIIKSGSHHSNHESLRLSYIYNIPIIGTLTSRTSFTETKSIIKAFHSYNSEAIPLFNENYFLIVLDERKPLNEDEIRLVNKSTLIHKEGKLSYYKISNFDFKRRDLSKTYQEINDCNNTINPTHPCTTDSNAFIYYMNFDSIKTSDSFMGEGSYIRNCDKKYKICKLNSLKFTSEKYILSFWLKKEHLHQLFNAVIISKENKKTKKNSWSYADSTRPFYFENDWYLIEKEITIEANKDIEYGFTFSDNLYNTDSTKFTLDNFLLRPKGTNTYLLDSENQRLLVNNKPLDIKGIKEVNLKF